METTVTIVISNIGWIINTIEAEDNSYKDLEQQVYDKHFLKTHRSLISLSSLIRNGSVFVKFTISYFFYVFIGRGG